MGRVAPFGIKEKPPQASERPTNNVPMAFPSRRNTWTNCLQGVEGVERHKVAVELSRRYFGFGLTPEEVEFILTDFGRRCNPPLEQDEIRIIISTVSSNKAPLFPDTAPWSNAISINAVLSEIISLIRRFAIIPPYADIAIALWVLHVWCLDAFTISPLLRIKSPTKECGKTTLLNLVGQLLPRNAFSSNFSTAVIYRLVDIHKVSLCIDEADLNVKRNEELISLVNSGYKREGAIAYRCSGDSNEPTPYNSWSGKALAGIGNLPETTESRSIQILMSKKKRGETIEKLRRKHDKDFEVLRQKCRRIALDFMNHLRDNEPEIPQELGDRQTDNWEPLLAIADLAGENWPQWGRQAAVTLSCQGKENETGKGEELLADLKEIFDRMYKQGHSNLPTEWIISSLCEKSERPWSEYNYGKTITPRQLANLLKPFQVRPRDVRIPTGVYKGYYGADLQDAFERYL